jgi:hypothetical protein
MPVSGYQLPGTGNTGCRLQGTGYRVMQVICILFLFTPVAGYQLPGACYREYRLQVKTGYRFQDICYRIQVSDPVPFLCLLSVTSYREYTF